MTDTANTPSFPELLTELAEYKDYFTEDDHIKILVEWLQEETGLGKISATLVVKHVAPLVISSLEKTAGVITGSVKAKLYERFSRFSEDSWYYRVSESILNSLQTKTDKSLDQALTSVDKASLQQLINDKVAWANLKIEYQGIVQLLSQQAELREALSKANARLVQIIEGLSIELELRTPSYFEQALFDKPPEKGSAHWLTYTSRQTKLVGRETELNLLDQFFNKDPDNKFSWWAITGDGGIGKSRLALDALIQQPGWQGGFLPEHKLDKPDALSQWQPSDPTIIVIDYAAKHAEKVAKWIDQFLQKKTEFKHPVRLLILERQHKDQSWWAETIASSSNDGLFRRNHLFSPNPFELQTLGQEDQQRALDGFLKSLGKPKKMPKPQDSFWQVLSDLSNGGRPLFIAMTAVALAEKSKQGLKSWTHTELLDFVLQHEQRCWDNLLSTVPDKKESIIKLLIISTLVSGFDWSKTDAVKECLKEAGVLSPTESLQTLWKHVVVLAGHDGGYLQPDLFAEYCLLKLLPLQDNGPYDETKKLLAAAYTIDPANMLDTLARTALDYSQDKTSWFWWDYLNNEYSGEDNPLENWAFSLVGRMSLTGKYQETIELWLPSLVESSDQKTKARALNLFGKQYLHVGGYETALTYLKQSLAIQKEIGDKSGEGTTLNNISQVFQARGDYETTLTYLKQSFAIKKEIGDKSAEGTLLNNISQIYDAHGDYETALTYLKQSLAIRKEIGDKAGEGTTLNNISQIFKARGDDETALTYLKQSLAIQKEIGDQSGLCATLFNIGLIHMQNDEISEAISTWLSVYVMAKEMNLAQALQALEGLAGQFGLPDDAPTGLDFWQMLLEQSEAESTE